MPAKKKHIVDNKIVYSVFYSDDSGGFWDLFMEEDGKEICINFGYPLYDEPTVEDIKYFLEDR